jgi:glycerol dehydrogenase-like iron-containing ADH family enzyme
MKDLPGPPKHRAYHGELVAFGTLVEMVLEDKVSISTKKFSKNI